jgi:hypothetical protein
MATIVEDSYHPGQFCVIDSTGAMIAPGFRSRSRAEAFLKTWQEALADTNRDRAERGLPPIVDVNDAVDH